MANAQYALVNKCYRLQLAWFLSSQRLTHGLNLEYAGHDDFCLYNSTLPDELEYLSSHLHQLFHRIITSSIHRVFFAAILTLFTSYFIRSIFIQYEKHHLGPRLGNPGFCPIVDYKSIAVYPCSSRPACTSRCIRQHHPIQWRCCLRQCFQFLQQRCHTQKTISIGAEDHPQLRTTSTWFWPNPRSRH